jgi:YesN/AraC family two-component response regulator
MTYIHHSGNDEPEIREGIRDTIPWESSGFMLMGACANGNEALSLIEQNLPDVLITDINMPFMDGLSLAERVLTLNPSTRVLIISGYDEFEYARKALKLQVYDYIVKPITPHEFKEILIRLKTNLDEERISLNLEQLKKQLAESFPLLRERFLNQLILGNSQRVKHYTWKNDFVSGIPSPYKTRSICAWYWMESIVGKGKSSTLTFLLNDKSWNRNWKQMSKQYSFRMMKTVW